MAKSHCVELDAIAVQLLSALGEYADGVAQLVQGWSAEPDMEHYARVSRQIDGIRDLCSLLPLVTVQWAAILISHAELMHALWRVSQSPASEPPPEERLEHHRAALASLQCKCRRMILHPDGQRSC